MFEGIYRRQIGDIMIFATGNEGKVREVKMMLEDAGLKLDLVTMREAGIEADIEENGKTFEENAIIKAKAIMEMTGEIAMADDSGLEVDYLDKAPGIYSARFLGEDTPYSVKNAHIIKQLEGVEGDERSARFVCVIAVAFPAQVSPNISSDVPSLGTPWTTISACPFFNKISPL